MANARIAVLIVEDEPLMRMDIAGALEDGGFLVFEAANADDAIIILVEHTEIQALFTDIDMPGSMDGLKLAAAVRKRWPPIKIIVTSGHQHIREENLPIDGRFFSKPYDPEKIISTIREMVAA
ncbi:response regulator (plasmid) [Rhizobium lusitanum]|uniref:response regulator n=1 Tax=Rhizobium lusitanum TaxID=293958 RepID=UPI0016097C78|nr:response regulator [Rhizobium lusitanum]QND46599.1 response regulator [Rhizobium lusitanum]